jgi:hypothetical protein
MSDTPYSVCVVLDREYGTRLLGLLETGPIWAIDSQSNREVVRRFWEKFPSRDEMDGLTVFKAACDRTSEEILLDEFATIDLHHGPYSADPPYTVIRVIGTSPTERIKRVLSGYGFDSFDVVEEGFRATRAIKRQESGVIVRPDSIQLVLAESRTARR